MLALIEESNCSRSLKDDSVRASGEMPVGPAGTEDVLVARFIDDPIEDCRKMSGGRPMCS